MSTLSKEAEPETNWEIVEPGFIDSDPKNQQSAVIQFKERIARQGKTIQDLNYEIGRLASEKIKQEVEYVKEISELREEIKRVSTIAGYAESLLLRAFSVQNAQKSSRLPPPDML